MTANKPMTGEQLDELMTVAVNMQRDAETDCNRHSAMFAYAVQVAVLELHKVRNDAVELEQKLAGSQREFRAADATIENLQMQVEKLAAENASKSRCLGFFASVIKSGEEWTSVCQHEYSEALKNPATDAFLAEVRAQGLERLAKAWYAIANETAPGISISESSRLKYRQRADDVADFANEIRKEAAQ